MPTYIDGIGSSEAIDTAGEIVSIKGLDCSSLTGAAFNYEHKSDLPAQIVGKVLECKKIFSENDCENERHRHFWDKCKIPFLYVMGRLFDDKKDSSKEIAALFLDDAEHPNENPMLGFSVEGVKLNKIGMIIDYSIARKITVTASPANKTCIAEMVPASKDPKTDIDALFKTESIEVEFFTPNKEFAEFLEKKEKEMNKVAPLSGGAPTSSMFASELKKDQPMLKPPAGPRAHPSKAPAESSGMNFRSKRVTSISSMGGSLGSMSSMGGFGGGLGKSIPGPISPPKPSAPKVTNPSAPPKTSQSGFMGTSRAGPRGTELHFTHPMHSEFGTSTVHQNESGGWSATHNGKPANFGGKSGANFPTAKEAATHLGQYHRAWKARKTSGNQMHNTASAAMMGKTELSKAMETGSGMTSPGMLAQGAALSKESLDRKIKKIGSKSHWLARAEEEYERWDKKEQFQSFMKKKLPHLSKGEIDVIGHIMTLNKALKAEKSLAKIMGSDYQGSFVPKSEKNCKDCKPLCKSDCANGCECHPMKKTTDIMMFSEKDKK